MKKEEKIKKLDIDELEKQIKECQQKKDEYLAGWQRAKADFINYKKGETERVSQFLSYGISELILRLLPILDNFDVSEKNLPEDLNNNEYLKGVLQIKSQVQEILNSFGVETIKAVGEKFDPNFHEAVEQIEGEGEAGTIVEEIQKGYSLQGKVVRPSKVKTVK